MKEAIIIAGGFGTRLAGVVSDLPKSMAPISGRPFLAILLTNLARNNFKRIILSLGFMADTIIDYFGREFAGMELVYVVEDTPLGTGGAIKLAMEVSLQDHQFVFNGDSFLDLEVDAVESLWRNNRNPVIVGVMVNDISRYGSLIIRDEKVVGFTEKSVSGPGLINAGCYILNNGQLDKFPTQTFFSLEGDVFPKMVSEIEIDLFTSRGYFIDIGVPGDYIRAQTSMDKF